MKKNIHNIFDKSACLTYREIENYISGDMTKDEIRRVELHIADCPMCSDEVEGYVMLKNKKNLPNIISDINDKIEAKLDSFKTLPLHSSTDKVSLKRIFSIAASVVLLIGAGFIIRFYMNSSSENMAEMKPVEQKIKEEPKTPAENQKEENINTLTVDNISGEKNKNEKKVSVSNKNTEIKDFHSEDKLETDKNISVDEVNETIVSENVGINDEEINNSETEDVVVLKSPSENEKKSLSSISEEKSVSENLFMGTAIRGRINLSKKRDIKEIEKYKSMRESGLLSYNMKIYAEALKDFTDYLKYRPNDFEIRYKTGFSYYKLKKYDKAISQFNKLINESINPYVEDAEWYKAKSLVNLNKKEEAKKLLNKIITENGKYQNKALDLLNNLQ